ncbi:MAG: hypothetical protein Q4E99_04310, partial [Bacillota bacterium]|nr:hypothetical protein [Bacillota bacterium]
MNYNTKTFLHPTGEKGYSENRNIVIPRERDKYVSFLQGGENDSVAGMDGGAIYFAKFNEFNLNGNIFVENVAKSAGGAIAVSGDGDTARTLKIVGGEFKYNSAKDYGGAINIDSIKYAEFDWGSATGLGQITLNIDDVEFTENTATGIKYTGKYTDGTDIWGTDESSYNAFGGAINSIGNAIINVGKEKQVKFSENTVAGNGGAICAGTGLDKDSSGITNEVNLYDVVMSNNGFGNTNTTVDDDYKMTGSSYGGGAIYAMQYANVAIDASCSIAEHDDAIYACGAKITITKNKLITDNKGRYVIGYTNKISNTITFDNTEIADNKVGTGYEDTTEMNYKYTDYTMLDVAKGNVAIGSISYARKSGYEKTTLMFIGETKIKDNAWASNASETRDVHINPNTTVLDWDDTFVAEKNVGIYSLWPTPVPVYYNWSKDNDKLTNVYNKGTLFRDYFFAESNNDGMMYGKTSAHGQYQVFRNNEIIYWGPQCVPVYFDFAVKGAPQNPEMQYIANFATCTYIDKPREICLDYKTTTEASYSVPNREFLGFMGKDIAYIDNNVFIDNFRLWKYDDDTSVTTPSALSATRSQFVFKNGDDDEDEKRIVLLGIYKCDFEIKACGCPVDVECDHPGQDGDHIVMDGSDTLHSMVEVMYREQMCYVDEDELARP